VLLRIEDHDRERSRPEFERAILDDLDWLGFVPDEPTTEDFRGGVCPGRQSDREAIYETALEGLRNQRLVYGCSCSRSDFSGGAPSTGEIPYPGTCRVKRLVDGPGLTIRVRLDSTVERFDDLLRGPQEQRPDQQCGDVVVRDRAGNWSYQFAAAVDDLAQDITMVIRGDDLLTSTGRQILLARLLGRQKPARFLHHPLVMKSPTQKLSKADNDTSIRDMRRRGVSPDHLIGQAAVLGGLLDKARPVVAAEAPVLLQKYMPALLARLAGAR
jgi:glutamyl-tRNA synthetase/glutamyl-Q tRNA(Asp) synthetase